MGRVAICVGVALALSTSVCAASVRSVINDFGLAGTWSENCSRGIGMPGGGRLTFAAPLFGAATLITDVPELVGQTSATFQITNAIKVTDDKIMLVLTWGPFKGMRMVFQKAHGKLRLYELYRKPDSNDMQIMNGMAPGNRPQPFLERCLN